MTTPRRLKVIIIGAGFGGLHAARALARAPVDVLLIDRQNHHTFFPLLYQVGAAELEPEAIAYPVRTILRKQRNADFLMASVTGIDLAKREVTTDGGAFAYDHLIVATGSTTSFFGVPGAGEHALPLRSLEHGIRLRGHILRSFERAAASADPEERRRLLTFAIAGGGPMGVEFAGALAELVRGPLRKDYRRLDLREVRLVLIEAGNAVLPTMPPRLQAYTVQRLQQVGLEVKFGATVTRVEPDGVWLKDGTNIPAGTVVWSAGVRGDPATSAWGLPVGRGGRVTVSPTLQVPAHPEVYVVGDLALTEGAAVPMVAPAAVQQGETAAANIARAVAGKPLAPFHYNDRGSVAVIGRNAAAAHLYNRWAFAGFFAWLL